MKIVKLKAVIQHYPWGDRHTLPELLGEKADGEPWAELWLGTHPKGPSLVAVDGKSISLEEYIDENYQERLGASSGNTLSFLMKILAIREPLSLQCHPTKMEAEAGFLRENRAGIPLDDPKRSYKDQNHKPEIICALSPLRALCGFRPIDEISNIFGMLESAFYERALKPVLLDPAVREAEALQRFYHRLLYVEGAEQEQFLSELKHGAVRLQDRDPGFRLAGKFLEMYPMDNAAAAPLYLNIVDLKSGEALYQSAGELHAYISGVGVELMANSDNVLRGGLTQKHIDREELERILIFSGNRKQIITPCTDSSGVQRYPSPTAEFQLERLYMEAHSRVDLEKRTSGEILLCTEGAGAITSIGREKILLKRGDAFFIPAAVSNYRLTAAEGKCQLFIASVPGRGEGE